MKEGRFWWEVMNRVCVLGGVALGFIVGSLVTEASRKLYQSGEEAEDEETSREPAGPAPRAERLRAQWEPQRGGNVTASCPLTPAVCPTHLWIPR